MPPKPAPHTLLYHNPHAASSRAPWASVALTLQLISIFSALFGALYTAGFVAADRGIPFPGILFFIGFPFSFLALGITYFIAARRIRQGSRGAVWVALICMALQIGIVYSLMACDLWPMLIPRNKHLVLQFPDPVNALALAICILLIPAALAILLPRMIRLLRAS